MCCLQLNPSPTNSNLHPFMFDCLVLESRKRRGFCLHMFYKKNCSKKLRKIFRKTLVAESLFNKLQKTGNSGRTSLLKRHHGTGFFQWDLRRSAAFHRTGINSSDNVNLRIFPANKNMLKVNNENVESICH